MDLTRTRYSLHGVAELLLAGPQHLDIAIELAEVSYGVSPGDALVPEPYAYAGRSTARMGRFWNQPFGADRPPSALGSAGAVASYFAEGAARALEDPSPDRADR